MENLLQSAQQLALEYGLNVLGALVIVILGFWFSSYFARWTLKGLERAKVTPALRGFLSSLVRYAIIIFAVIAALQVMGVPTTSFVAVLGAASLAVGLALEGSLSNFAAGVLILFFRPFKIGDVIEAAGQTGGVEDIQIFNTVLLTPDNKTIIIPNAQVTSGVIVNYSKKGILRLDLSYGIGYGDDLLKAKKVLLEILENHEAVLEDPAPSVAVLELADSSVNFAVRPYVKVADALSVPLDLNEIIKLRFDAEGISIPFPQQDVHLFPVKASAN